MGSNVIATLKEAFATAPGITAIDLAVLTRMHDTQRLGFVAYGRWSRRAVESARWRQSSDALRFLDIADEVSCSVTTTASGNVSTSVKPLNIERLEGLGILLDNALDEPGSAEPSLGRLEADMAAEPARPPSPADPYQVVPFAEWKQQTAPAPQFQHAPTPPPPPFSPPTAMVPGQNVVLPESAQQGLQLSFSSAGAEADLTLLLTGADGLVTGDEDFLFYNQPTAAHGAARLLGKQHEGLYRVERAALHLAALPAHVQRVVVSVNMDVDTGLTCQALTHASLQITCLAGTSWRFQAPADPAISAMVVAEFYRHTSNGSLVWKLRAVGQGWADGLDGLARAHGVHVD